MQVAVAVVGDDEIIDHPRRLAAEIGALDQCSRDEGGKCHRLALAAQLETLGEAIEIVMNPEPRHDI